MGKNWIVNTIKLGFSLLFYKTNLVLAVQIKIAVFNIEKSIIYTCLKIGIRNN